jgi:hypothetical protein
VVTQPVPDVGYPCASDYAVCVGGTVIGAQGTTYPKSAQAASQTSWTYTGGGSSFYLAAPSFQKNVTAVNVDCISQPDGTPYPSTTQCRGVPDIAALSGDSAGDGYTIYFDGLSLGAGGTSLSSPLSVGMWARIQSAAPVPRQQAGGLGFADPLIYRQASDADTCGTGAGASAISNVAPNTNPCPNAPVYNRDFFDINTSEDIADQAGIGTTVIGAQPPSTGVGAGNGFYSPTPGWDYTSGWGTFNVANFMQDVDGSQNAATAYTGPEATAYPACTFKGTSPVGNATDSVTGMNDPGADLTQATISAPTPGAITATFTVPQLSSGLPTGASGVDFYAVWVYNGTTYYANAHESATGFSYTSGTISGISRTATTGSTATGSADMGSGVITVTVPTSEVGKPGPGALLSDPQAYDVVDNAAATVLVVPATDSADELYPVNLDSGETNSIGVSVVVGGVPGGNCLSALPTPAPTPAGARVSPPNPAAPPAGTGFTDSPGGVVACTTRSRRPVTAIRTKLLRARVVRLTGVAIAHCPDHIVKVQIAIARVLDQHGRRCRFLQANDRFGRVVGCAPRSYLPAIGTDLWTFVLRVHLPNGVYHLWEHAIDNRRVATINTARKYVWFRIGPRPRPRRRHR